MLRLRSSILAHLLSSPATSPVSPLHRLLSAAAPAMSTPTTGFAVEDYLVSTCGLTRPQALKASGKLSHLRSTAKPDAVLAFLAGIGLFTGDVAALVAKDPQFLCASVERTLAPVVTGLSGLGLTRSEISRLVSVSAGVFRKRSIVSNVQYCLPLLGSFQNLLHAVSSCLLKADLQQVVKPNIALLQETRLGACDIAKLSIVSNLQYCRVCPSSGPLRTSYMRSAMAPALSRLTSSGWSSPTSLSLLQKSGLGACDIAKLCRTVPRLLSSNLEHVQAVVASAEAVGLPHGSGMFRYALQSVAFFSEEMIAARVDSLKKTFRWSDADVSIALCRAPLLLTKSNELLQCRSEFLISEVGLEPAYLAQRPTMLCYSLEGRMRPRNYVVKFLKENGLLKRDPSYYTVFKEAEKYFVKKFICPHKEHAPHLAEDYAAACGGEVPARFRFT
ncbi:hypothetical protein VPH35_102261 [Triticum aestivum]